MIGLNPEPLDVLVLNKINDIISNRQPITPFEDRFIKTSLDSLCKVDKKKYYEVYSAYQCVMCNADGVKESIKCLLEEYPKLDNSSFEFVVKSLSNVWLYEYAHSIIEHVNFDSCIQFLDDDVISLCLMIFIINNNDEKLNDISRLMSDASKKYKKSIMASRIYNTIDTVCKSNDLDKSAVTKFIRGGLEVFTTSIVKSFSTKIFLPSFNVTKSDDESISYIRVGIDYPEGTDLDIIFESSDMLIDKMFEGELNNTPNEIRQTVVFSVSSGDQETETDENDYVFEIGESMNSEVTSNSGTIQQYNGNETKNNNDCTVIPFPARRR